MNKPKDCRHVPDTEKFSKRHGSRIRCIYCNFHESPEFLIVAKEDAAKTDIRYAHPYCVPIYQEVG